MTITMRYEDYNRMQDFAHEVKRLRRINMYKCIIWSNSSNVREYDIRTKSAYKAAFAMKKHLEEHKAKEAATEKERRKNNEDSASENKQL
jgi:hypothetical protein